MQVHLGVVRWRQAGLTTRPRIVKVSWDRRMSSRTETFCLPKSRPNRASQPPSTNCSPSVRIKIKVRNCNSLTASLLIQRTIIRDKIVAQRPACSLARSTTKSVRNEAPTVLKTRDLSNQSTKFETLIRAR